MNEARFNDEIAPFIAALKQLGAADRARLRRNAGRTRAESRQVLGLFFRIAPPGLEPYDLDTYFMVATLYPLAADGGLGNLGVALRQARSPQSQKGLDRRLEVLLDSDRGQLPFRLRQAVHLLSSLQIRIDWTQLLADLLEWGLPSRTIQEQWARAYFTPEAKKSSKGQQRGKE